MNDEPTLVSETEHSTPSGPSRPLGAGTRIGRYTVGREIGRGAMGIVYEAEDTELGRRVAVKALRGYAGERERNELIREARASAQLSSPYVVEVFAVSIADDGTPCVITELVEGQSLRAWLEDAKRRQGEILDVFEDAARGLIAIHQRGIVHRDFKPDNVIVGRDGRLRIADFGLARGGTCLTRALSNDDAAMVSEEFESAEDRTGRRPRGTPAYMAPELFTHAPATAVSDQYAYCASLFEALVGHRPFTGRSPAEIAAAQLQAAVAVPRGVPSDLAKLLRKGLAVHPGDRFESMAALLDRLRRVRVGGRRRRRMLLVGAAALLPTVLLLAGPDSPGDRCAEVGRDAGAAWGAVRSSVDAKLRALGGPRAPDAAARIVARIDRWADDLAVAQRELCLASPGRPAEVVRQRSACLEEARLRGESFVAVLDELELDSIEPATMAVHSLPRPQRCLGSVLDTPESSDDATALRLRAYDLRFRAQLGELDLLDESVDLVAEAERSGDPWTRVVALQSLADVADRLREAERAEAALTRAAQLAEEADLPRQQGDVAYQHARLAGVRGTDFERARELAEKAIDLFTLHDPEMVARATIRLGEILHHAGDPESGRDFAEAGMLELERRIEIHDSALLHGYSALSSMEYDLGDVERARELGDLAAELAAEMLGETHGQTLTMLNNAVVLRAQSGDLRGALERAEDLHLRRTMVLGAEHPETAASWQNLAGLRFGDGQVEAGIEASRRAVEAYTALEGPDGRDAAEARVALAVLLANAGRNAEAMDALENAYASLVAKLGAHHPGTLVAGLQWAELLAAEGREDEALPLIEALGDVASEHPTSFVASNALMLRARTRMASGNEAGAQADIEGAIASLRAPTAAPKQRTELGRWLEMIGWAPTFEWSP